MGAHGTVVLVSSTLAALRGSQAEVSLPHTERLQRHRFRACAWKWTAVDSDCNGGRIASGADRVREHAAGDGGENGCDRRFFGISHWHADRFEQPERQRASKRNHAIRCRARGARRKSTSQRLSNMESLDPELCRADTSTLNWDLRSSLRFLRSPGRSMAKNSIQMQAWRKWDSVRWRFGILQNRKFGSWK